MNGRELTSLVRILLSLIRQSGRPVPKVAPSGEAKR